MLQTLRQITQEVSSAPNFQEALNTMVVRTAQSLETQACSIFLLDHRREKYILMATHGLNQAAVGKVRIPLNKGLIGYIGEREEPLNIDDASKHAHFLPISEIKEEAYKAFLGAPIIYHRKVLGVLVAQQSDPRRYDDAEEAFLQTMALQMAAIIAHAEATGALKLLLNRSVLAREDLVLTGIPGAPGIGIGLGAVVFKTSDLEQIPDRAPHNIDEEITALETALASVRSDLQALSERLQPNLAPEEQAIFEVYQRILDSDELGAEIKAAIRRGNWAPGALREIVQLHIFRLEAMESEYLRERATDIKDLAYRVLAYLQRDNQVLPQYSKHTVLIGEELAAADLAQVPRGCLAAVISAKGSSSSHLAILARAMKIPTVMGVSNISLQELSGKEMIVDGHHGQIYVTPSASVRTEFQQMAVEEQQLDATLGVLRDLPATTLDNYTVTMWVNAGLRADISSSLAAGAEGVGLYRTEVPFLIRDRFPTGEEQRVIYRQLLASFAPRPVTMRTLDVGGDKPLPYFPIAEENPFLGWRGIRLTLDHPEIFLSQIRAMLRASEGLSNLRIMLPMISDVSEVDEALRLIKKAYTEVLAEGHHIVMPPVGVMIEVPSAVYQVRSLAKRVDFLSVGSNDLTQYILAVDRNNARVANLYDALHPAVLRALIQIAESGHKEGKHVSICGEMAGDPVAVMLLVAMGFDSLSMGSAALGRCKWIIRHFTQKKAAQLLQEVLALESAPMVRAYMETALEKAGVGDIMRLGR